MYPILADTALATLTVPAATFLFSAGLLARDARRLGRDAATGVDNMAMVIAAGQLIHQLQRERGMTAGFLSQPDAQNPLGEQRRATDEALAAFSLDGIAEFGRAAGVTGAVREGLASLPAQRAAIDQRALPLAQAVMGYTGRIGAFLDLIEMAVKISGRGSPARLATAYLNLLTLKEAAGQERALLSGALGSQSVTAATRRRAADFQEQQQLRHDLFIEQAGEELRSSYRRGLRACEDEVIFLRLKILDETSGGPLPRQASWFDAATRRIDALKAVQELVEERLYAAAVRQRDTAHQHMRRLAGLCAGAAALLGGIGAVLATGWP